MSELSKVMRKASSSARLSPSSSRTLCGINCSSPNKDDTDLTSPPNT